MEEHKYEKVHYNSMEPRAEGHGLPAQRSVQGPPSSNTSNARPLEANVLGAVRPVNFSIQTGEEFALEFMRERAHSRKTSVQNASGDQNNASNYADLKGILSLSHAESESGSDISMLAAGEKGWKKDLDKNFDSENKGHYESDRIATHASSADGSSRGNPHVYGSSGASDTLSAKMKFLCSFGGKILPRPSDGKLRYVGGETRIIRISKDISWHEFVQKTSSIHSQAHTIKYQLPGEDLDALVSVSCDEDLQNMIEECSLLESGEGSQKLRMFLFSSGDFDDIQFGLGSMEGNSEIQYVVAVNGMDVGSGMISSGHGQLNTPANDLDLLNLNSQGDMDTNKLDVESLRTGAAPVVGATVPPFTTLSSTSNQPGLSNDYDIQMHSYQDQRLHHEEARQHFSSNGNPHDEINNTSSRISIPLSLSTDYNYISHYGPFGGTSVAMAVHELLPSKQGGTTEGLYSGFRTEKEKAIKNANLKAEGSVSQKIEGEPSGSSETELHAHAFQHEGLTSRHLRSEEISNGASSQEYKTSLLTSKHKAHVESEAPEQKLSPLESGNDSQIYESNDGGLYASGEGHISGFSNSEYDIADVSYSEAPSHPFRVFHSERIPREQADLVNRLSKSDDSFGSQFLMPHSRAALSQQESISETVDPLHEGSLVSQYENSTQCGKQPHLNVTTIEDGLLQFEKYKELADAITRSNQVDSLPTKEGSETPCLSRQPILIDNESLANWNLHDLEDGRGNHTVHAAHGQTEAAEDQTFKMGKKLQRSEFPCATLVSSDDKRATNVDKICLESDTSRLRESHISVGDMGQLKVQLPEPVINETESVGSTGIANIAKKQDDPASSLSELQWGDISTESVHLKDVKEQASTYAWPESSAGGVSQPESSDNTLQRADILIDINDRFPRDLLSDLFSKARIPEDLSSTNTMRKDDAGLSLNMHNPEPKRWSFFRNLAQNEFAHNVSLIDQDHIPYASSFTNVEDGGPMTYGFSPLNTDMVYDVSQIDFNDEIQPVSSGNVNNATTVSPVCIPSQAGDDGAQMENPLRTPLSEYEEMKLDISNIGGPAIDTSSGEFCNLQIIKNEDLEELKELGSGTFGTVYHGKWRGTDVAIKRIKKSCFTGRSSEQERLTEEFWREAEILSSLHHPNVVAFYGVVKDGPGGTLATVTEFMVNGSLRHVLLRKDRYLDRRKRLIIAMDAAIGMEYLHTKNIVHFDLKCDNLLVNLKDPQRPICKVGDFGLSKIKRNTLVSGGVRGTLPWMAPELLNGSSNKVSEKVDVFSFGIVMWEILTGDEPYSNMHYGAIIGGIVSNTLRPSVPAICDPEWKRLMEQCWAPDPVQRPSFTEIAGRLRAMSVALQNKTHNAK
uniref:Serine/threonine-protein kinase CTR1 n=1 Tax=Anthurium amnicola TaxID=1678845 RepID=A0A1D1ZIM6_9ARAE